MVSSRNKFLRKFTMNNHHVQQGQQQAQQQVQNQVQVQGQVQVVGWNETSIYATNYVPNVDIQWKELNPTVIFVDQPIQMTTTTTSSEKECCCCCTCFHDRGRGVRKNKMNMMLSSSSSSSSSNHTTNDQQLLLEYNKEFRYAIEYEKFWKQKRLMMNPISMNGNITSSGSSTTINNNNPMYQQQQQQQIPSSSSTLSMTTIPDPLIQMDDENNKYLIFLKHQQQMVQNALEDHVTNMMVSNTMFNNNTVHLQETMNKHDHVQEYVTSFLLLLQYEREDKLQLYETNYTQYQQKIKVIHHHHNNVVVPPQPQPSGTTTTTSSVTTSVTTPTFVTAMIPGLADSHPVPEPGDYMILRPKQHLSLPIVPMYQNHHPNHHHHNTPNINNNNNTNIDYVNGTKEYQIEILQKQQQMEQENIQNYLQQYSQYKQYVFQYQQQYQQQPVQQLPPPPPPVPPAVIPKPMWSPPIHIVDIRCTVTNISRSNPKTTTMTTTSSTKSSMSGRGDTITCTWLQPEHVRILQQVYDIENGIYQLRIVPNRKQYDRCCVALQWLVTTFGNSTFSATENKKKDDSDTTPPSEMMKNNNNHINYETVLVPILFPTQPTSLLVPPNHMISNNNDNYNDDNIWSTKTTTKMMMNNVIGTDELNHEQMSFVRILLNRTNVPPPLYQPDNTNNNYNNNNMKNHYQYHGQKRMIRSPLILTGPAGTGKTKTLLHGIIELMKQNYDSYYYHFNNNNNNTHHHHHHHSTTGSNTLHRNTINRILICTPSHTAANVITQRLASLLLKLHESFESVVGGTTTTTDELQQSPKSSVPGPPKNILFRLLDPDRDSATIPLNILSYCSRNEITGQFQIPSMETLLQYQIIVSTCVDSYLLYEIGCTNEQIRYKQDIIYQQCIRYNMVNNHNPSTLFLQQPHFTHFFMDEAAQATEPETIIPFSVVLDHQEQQQDEEDKNKMGGGGVLVRHYRRPVELVFVGDPRQLAPRLCSKRARQAGLQCSYMERLLQRRSSPTTTTTNGTPLKKNHTNHESNDHKNENDDMLGPDFVEVEDWLHYSMEQDGPEQMTIYLLQNYRGHPSFLMLTSPLFYHDKLRRAGYNEVDTMIQEEIYWSQQLRQLEMLVPPTPVVMVTKPTATSLTASPLTTTPKAKQTSTPRTHDTTATVAAGNDDNLNMGTTTTTSTSGEAHIEGTMDDDFISRPKKQWNWPIHFRGVIGQDKKSSIQSNLGSDSWCNDAEARVVLEVVQELTKAIQPNGIGGGAGVSTSRIGVMAPFRGQVVLIRRYLRSHNLGGIDVGTIEDYQSAERDVIILSLTRSTESFVDRDNHDDVGVFGQQQAKRCNVALSRAQSLLIVIGNPNVMIKDFLWRQFLFFCYRNVLWYGESVRDMTPFLPTTTIMTHHEANNSTKNKKIMVNSYDILKETNRNNNSSMMMKKKTESPSTTESNKDEKDVDELSNLIVVSTLERLLRK